MIDIKEIKALIKLCRSTGVEHLKVGSVEIKLGDEPLLIKKQVTKPEQVVTYNQITEDTQIETFDALTEEQMLFYSTGMGAEG